MADPYAGIAGSLAQQDHDPKRYGGGFYGGFMSVVGPHMDAQEADELAQKQYERQHFYDMMTNKALAIQPGLWVKYVEQKGYDKLLFRREDNGQICCYRAFSFLR